MKNTAKNIPLKISHSGLKLLLPAMLFLTSCTFVWQSDYQPAAEEQAGETQPLAQEVAETSWVELLWQVPDEKIDKYHIYYGSQPGNLSSHEEIEVTKLAVIFHPKFGKVYQYRIDDIPANAPIYVALQAENVNGISQPTPTIRMEPGQTAPLQ